MRILGIDPGTLSLGYGVIDVRGGRARLVSCGAIRASRRTPLPRRLSAIYDGLEALLAGSPPDCVAIEEVFHGRNFRAAIQIGQSRGIALLCTGRAGIPLAEYSAAVVKKAVVGNGRAHKEQVQAMVQHLLGLDAPPEPHDAADALAIALCHAHRCVG